jgi:capsule biosynthesis phosphatase
MSKTLVIDLDGTICEQKTFADYEIAEPVWSVIEKMVELYDEGWHIHIFTARGMNTFDGNVELIEYHLRGPTEEWLRRYNVPYHELSFGKPPGDLYVDDKGMNVDVFSNSD